MQPQILPSLKLKTTSSVGSAAEVGGCWSPTVPHRQVWQKLKGDNYSFKFLPAFPPSVFSIIRLSGAKKKKCGYPFLSRVLRWPFYPELPLQLVPTVCRVCCDAGGRFPLCWAPASSRPDLHASATGVLFLYLYDFVFSPFRLEYVMVSLR